MSKFQEWFKAQPLGFKGRIAVSELDDYAACWNAAIEAAVKMVENLYPCDCDVAYTSRGRHATDCIWREYQEAAAHILDLKEPQ